MGCGLWVVGCEVRGVRFGVCGEWGVRGVGYGVCGVGCRVWGVGCGVGGVVKSVQSSAPPSQLPFQCVHLTHELTHQLRCLAFI